MKSERIAGSDACATNQVNHTVKGRAGDPADTAAEEPRGSRAPQARTGGTKPCSSVEQEDSAGRADGNESALLGERTGTGANGAPRPASSADTSKLPRLAMAPEHGAAIVRLSKTSTMRTKPQPGRYLVEGRPKHKGDPPLRAAVTLTYEGEVWWDKLDEDERYDLARDEGYPAIHPADATHKVRELARAGAVARFLGAVRRIYYRGGVAERWINGERPLHKHRISEVEVLEEGLGIRE